MYKNLSENQKGLLTALVLFITTSTNYIFYSGSFVASSFCISVGLAIGFYYNLEKKIIYYIFTSIVTSHIVFRYLFLDESLFDVIYNSLVLSLVSILIIYLMKRIAVSFDLIGNISIKNASIFLTGTVISSLLAGIFISNLMIINNSSLDLFTIFIKWSTGFFFGITIFGTGILYSFHYNEGLKSSLKNNIFGAIYIVTFILVASIVFSNTVSWLSFEKYSYIFMLFYAVLSFKFSYRLILVTNVLFIYIFQYFYIYMGNNFEFTFSIFSVSSYLLALSLFATLVKVAIYELDMRNKALIASSAKLENLVFSTNSLLKLSDDIIGSDSDIQENYIIRIFKIACNIFDNYDYASCYIRGEDSVKFVDAVGYDVKTLNSFKFESRRVDDFDLENPIHVSNEDKKLKVTLKDKYKDFRENYPAISEAIRFGICIDKDTVVSLSFDIMKNSGKKFLRDDFENMKSFQKLMNSFLSINSLNYKNVSLKNDIVLSLIRTLELYDQYTGGHSEEVAFLSNEIGRRMGLNEHDLYDVYWAAVVHDIGKVGIASTIINKPSKLSLEEYELIKEHSIFGYDILNKAEDLKDIATLVKHHHEWWNGAGYPSELKGNDIPLGSQILSICDAVSTMAKKRPYTTVKTSNEIIDELIMYSGIQFSPEPTKHMIDFINEGLLDKYYINR